jgi:5-methylthioribose kinase
LTEDEVLGFLARQGLAEAGTRVTVTPLAGGVSSDIVRVELPDRTICVKRARAELKVSGRWTADVGRNAHEVAWLRVAGRIVPGAVPGVLAADPVANVFAMPYFDPARYPVWKSQLLASDVRPATARAVAVAVATIHAATADDPALAAEFAWDADFAALRLDPYLRATAAAHPSLASRLLALAERTAHTRRALVHGDVSPKNVLVGPDGPVLLDAECAWYGDPAFDAAFCLNHLLLKCLVNPGCTADYLGAFAAFVDEYARRASWEPWPELEQRIASLLPALMLARVDGLSPVEYLRDDQRKNLVRAFAGAQLLDAPRSLERLSGHWAVRIEGSAR